jgi:UDP-N-acetylmuramoylalanine--D-glutamate ligase
MKPPVPRTFSGQQVAVLGLGRSGEAASLLLAQLGATVTALDSASAGSLGAEKIARLRAQGIDVIAGAQASPDRCDLGIISPGIDPETPLVRDFRARGIPLIAEIELAWRACAAPVIGITGTNGKTTTTELVAAMLGHAGVRTVAAGNIGKPYSEVAMESAELDVVTLEISSFQLEGIETFQPAVSVWLNFTPDHLDRYRDEEEYRTAKLRIFENQTSEDWAVINAGETLPPLAARTITFSAYGAPADLHLRNEVIHYQEQPVLDPRATRLRGKHNVENLMAALGVGLTRGLKPDQMRPALEAYVPQPHRCEVVAEIDGVLYINDSKATNLDALEKALRSETHPVILIAGGKDKGFDFDPLAPLVKMHVRQAILIGEMAERIDAAWKAYVPCTRAASLAEAVTLAWSMARPGEVVLFSPGTSSFDMFKSYADRGNQFRARVQALRSASATPIS